MGKQLNLFDKPINQLSLRTDIHAKFEYLTPPTPEEQISVDALNGHAEEICESLQPIFNSLVINMLELKRGHFAKGGK